MRLVIKEDRVAIVIAGLLSRHREVCETLASCNGKVDADAVDELLMIQEVLEDAGCHEGYDRIELKWDSEVLQ